VLVVPGDDPRLAARILGGHDPDAELRAGADGLDVELDERRPGSAHELHPELAMLLSTSGSTGSPKLVRLSATNLDSNARAIAAYLGLRADDRAALTLPLHYCYGLSVLHSHLAVGASVMVGAGSVVDPCFWGRFRSSGATSLAGVPHTFDLLDRVGFTEMDLPSLRFVTQAGGRLAPETIRRYAGVGARDGWDLYVMYGQTEATARMAYLPPALAVEVPDAVGRAIPGGSLRVDGPDADGVGELVYRGPNVMMGHATGPADLARGPELDELRTGDLGRIDDRGLVHVVGRRSRFAKLFGLRLDLDELERRLAAEAPVLCASDDELLAVGVAAPADVDAVVARLRDELGLPRGAVVGVPFDELPRLASGKPDAATVLARARATRPASPLAGGEGSHAPESSAAPPVTAVRAALAEVLGCGDVAPDDTFVGLGGDSLSYVEVAMVLEEHLRDLPDDWHLRTVAELEALEPGRHALRSVETNVGLRAAAITLVVGSHAGIFTVLGGAHVLLAVAGYNFARFHATGEGGARQLRRGLTSVARIALPVLVWISMMFTWREPFSVPRLLLVDNVVGEGLWRYWFVEVVVQLLVVLTVVLAVPSVRDAERRAPFRFALALLGASLALRFGLTPLGAPAEAMYRTDTVAWVFFAGWAAQRASTFGQRALVVAAAMVALPGFFDGSTRSIVVAAGLLALVWAPRLRAPAPLHRLVAAVAGASLWIFLTHFAVFPLLRPHVAPVVLFGVAFPVGIVAAALVDGATARIGRARRSMAGAAPQPAVSVGG
jgi:acyl carrier protein